MRAARHRRDAPEPSPKSCRRADAPVGSAFLMLFSPRMMGVEQQVCVDQDHR
jgi:hypothetical protein